MEIVVDPYARNPWDIRYWLHHAFVDIDSLVDEFGSDVKDKVKAEKDSGTAQLFQMKLLDLMTRSSQAGGTYGLTSAVQDVQLDHGAIRKAFYRLPSRSYPNGELMVTAGGQVLHYDKYPFRSASGKAYRNLHWYRYSLIPGCPYGFGMPRNLRNPQKRRNGMLTQSDLVRKTMGNPQWLAARGSEFDDEGTARPGKVNLWTPKASARRFPPQRLDGKGMPPDFWREVDQTTADIDRISGENDVMRGVNPEGVTAGVSLELLAERASGRFEPVISERRHVIKTMDECRLMLVGKSGAWAYGKRILVRDEDGAQEMLDLNNLDAPEDPDIEVETTSTVLWSQAAKKQNISELLAAGGIDTSLPQNRRRLREVFNASEFDDPMGADTRLAEHENQLLLSGREVRTRPFENPVIHNPVHRRLTLRPDYDDLSPKVKAFIEAHMAETQDGLSKLAQDMNEAQTAPEAAVPPSLNRAVAGPASAEAGGEAPPQEPAQ